MAKGGIYDQVGGGFARYSVDAHWLVPHFEKMLYDNALLARAYLHAWQLTGQRAVPARVRGDARLGAARDARPRGRLLLRARRRLGGRGGQVLRLVGGGAARAARGRRPADAGATGASTAGRTSRGAASCTSPGGDDRPGRCSSGRAGRCTRCAPQRVWPGLDDKRLDGLERAHDRGAGRRRRGARACRLPRGRPPVRPVPARPDARPRRPAAAHLQGRPRGAERIPRGPRLPARGAAGALRGDVRDALVHRGPRARRHDDRALRSTRGRLLRHLQRPRGADRAPAELRGPPDPVGQLLRRLRPGAAGGVHRRAGLRAPRRRGARHPAPGRRPPSAGVRPSAAGAAVPLRPQARGGARGRAAGRARGGRCAHGFARPRSVAGMRPATPRRRRWCRCCAGREPVDGRPRRTCARTSPAGCRSPSRPSWNASSPD